MLTQSMKQSIQTVRAILVETPQKHRQNAWINDDMYYESRKIKPYADKRGCGTVMCVAGHLAYIEDRTINAIVNRYKDLYDLFFSTVLPTESVIGYLDRLLDGEDPVLVTQDARQENFNILDDRNRF